MFNIEFACMCDPQMLQALLQSKDPRDLAAANALIKEMVKAVWNRLVGLLHVMQSLCRPYQADSLLTV
jgi:hypothetical protein